MEPSDNGQHIYTPGEYTGPSELVHLHNHTWYSTLDGVADPKMYARECAKRGYPAMAATEHGNVASIPDMYFEFKKAKVKFIAGNEIYFSDDHLKACELRQNGLTPQRVNQSEDPELWESYLRCYRSRHVTVLAKNEIGLQNLIRLTTDANRYGTWRSNKPGRLWFDRLCQYKEGLIILSGCLNGPVAYELRRRQAIRIQVKQGEKTYWRVKEQGPLLPRNQRLGAALKEVLRWRDAFGADYVMEVQMPVVTERPGEIALHPEDRFEHDMLDLQVFRDSIDIADLLHIPIALTNDIHYQSQDDYQLQRLMMAIEQDVTVDSPDLFTSNSNQQFMKSRADLWATWKNLHYSVGLDDRLFEQMCDNTLEIASRCKFLNVDTKPKTPDWADADMELRRRTHEALRRTGLDRDERRFLVDGQMVTHAEQVEIELDRFISKGFSSYFLITADLVNYGKSKGYPFGPRGSAGGSLVCMLLGIHALNPLLWQLSFDRFLSPSRGGFLLNVKMPENK